MVVAVNQQPHIEMSPCVEHSRNKLQFGYRKQKVVLSKKPPENIPRGLNMVETIPPNS